ncbi:MAG TPA: hypothetical protein VK436_06185 [Methanocella sp.]|nr:hypothetical protein [Methanocella sp.]
MWTRTLCLLFATVLVTAASGCFGIGTAPPNFKDQETKFDSTVQLYNHAKDLYRNGNYTPAKAEFIDALNQFKDNKAAYETISKQNISSKEKKIASDMSSNAEQYAYAAAFMRDAADSGARGDHDNAYAIELNADEFDLVARNNYQDNKQAMEEYWNSQKQ